ncbi:MAG: hypothetical protein WDK96_04070 [Candidatus Paceibacterota bacterium]|jgi:hypothetical protein
MNEVKITKKSDKGRMTRKAFLKALRMNVNPDSNEINIEGVIKDLENHEFTGVKKAIVYQMGILRKEGKIEDIAKGKYSLKGKVPRVKMSFKKKRKIQRLKNLL